MTNRVISNPTAQDASELFSEFECVYNDIISLSADDFIDTLKKASFTFVIEDSAGGPERLKEALAKVKYTFNDIAPNLNIFDASKVLCLLVIPKGFLVTEMEHLTEFLRNFSDDTVIIWGVKQNESDDSDSITVKLLLSFV